MQYVKHGQEVQAANEDAEFEGNPVQEWDILA